jgi:hypothetical protein
MTKSTETLASDAIERMARRLGLIVDLDDPEQALIAAVERRVEELIVQRYERDPPRRESPALN